MNNEDKARILASGIDCEKKQRNEIRRAILKMAQWKDEQVKQTIQTMMDDCDSTNPYHVYRHDALNDLYEKLFEVSL